MRVFCIYFLEEKIEKEFLENFAETCYAITPQIALGERWIYLEVSKCKKIQSEKRIYLQIQIFLKKWNQKAKISLSDNMPQSLCQILFQKKEQKDFPIAAIQFYFQPFSFSKEFGGTTEKFQKLGIDTFDDLFKIPKSEIVSRLGRNFAQVLRHIDDADLILWPQFTFKETISSSITVDEFSLVKGLEPLMFLLKSALDPCFLRSKAQDLSLTHLYLKIEMEKYSFVKNSVREFQIEFPFPQNHTFSVLQILRPKLDFEFQQRPIESEVKMILIQFSKTTQRSAGQTNLFSKKEESLESLQCLISRLLETLGKDKVFYASEKESYLPEKKWEKILAEPTQQKSNLPIRPTRIFKKPILMTIQNQILKFGQNEFQILEKLTIEKITSHWWDQEEERTYHEVRVSRNKKSGSSPMRLWMYESQGNYFLHGLYD
ncbi:MAG: hypothetical protein ACK5P5_12940 [Pseudobdellovibrionaceae bacterium]